MSRNKALLLSVKPEFASLLLDGSKTVELRRQMPRVQPGDVVAVYVSSPCKQLVGTAEVLAVQLDKPSDLWGRVAGKAGVTRQQYDDYFAGAKHAVGIFLGKMKTRGSPLSLGKLRGLIDGFTVPQSYRYLGEGERRALGI